MEQRIVVATSALPFAGGGSQVLMEQLLAALERLGHSCQGWVLPQNRFGRQGAAYAAALCTDLERDADDRPVDRLISLRFPAYALRHPNQIVWLCHRQREYYDLWSERGPELRHPWTRFKEEIRRGLMHRADRRFLRRARRVFAISETVAERLRRWGGIPAEVLRPPPPVREYRHEPAEPFILAVSRLQPLKRQELLLRGMARTGTTNLKAILVGEGPDRERLQGLTRELGLEERVKIRGRVSEEELVSLYARCLGVFFAPLREDFGFVAVEAFASGKPVVTCSDGGGPAELVQDGQSGLVIPAEPEAVAAALDRLARHPEAAEAMGLQGRDQIASMSWEAIARRLVVE